MLKGINIRLNPKLRDMVVKIPINVYSILVHKYGTDGSPPLLVADVGLAGCPTCEVIYIHTHIINIVDTV